jgi:NAD(P)-dependent dehydrogenase (short-subunit alcohol dehydrogenase family)
VSLSSDAGRVGSSGEAVYAACKGGITAFSKSIAREHARDGIAINVVAPGPTDTPLFARFDPGGKLAAALERAIPMRPARAAAPTTRASSRSCSRTRPASSRARRISVLGRPRRCTGRRRISMEYTDILYDVKDRVATITINRPRC